MKKSPTSFKWFPLGWEVEPFAVLDAKEGGIEISRKYFELCVGCVAQASLLASEL